MNRMCARLLNKKNTLKRIGSRLTDNAIILLMFVPVTLSIYLYVLAAAIADSEPDVNG